jgi:molybdenum cofactor synthesis domain-containing protein
VKKIERLENVAKKQHPVISIMPYRQLKVGAVVTGSEIYDGIIKDEFDKYVGKKVSAYGSRVIKKILVPDKVAVIAKAVAELINLGCDLILTTGGLSVDPDDVTRQGVKKIGAEVVAYGAPVLPGAMFLYARLKGTPILGLILTTGGLSVDPDDVTRQGVKKIGAEVVAYGAPVLPGAMFLYARLEGTPILGLPACVYYHESTIFDLIYPRVLAGDRISKNEIAEMGHGGLCLNCDRCQFPVCPFGK